MGIVALEVFRVSCLPPSSVKTVEQINPDLAIKAMRLDGTIEIYSENRDVAQQHLTEIVDGDLVALFADTEYLRYLAWLAQNADLDRYRSSPWVRVFNQIKIRCFCPPIWTPCKTTASGSGLEIRRQGTR